MSRASSLFASSILEKAGFSTSSTSSLSSVDDNASSTPPSTPTRQTPTIKDPTQASEPLPSPTPSLSIDKLSTLRLLVTHIGAALTLFLATTDATIVSTALPTIASDLSASQLQYTWVGVAYMLTQTAFQPLYGRISDLVGRKAVLFASIMVFCVGSVLCGAAKSIEWLIAARALAGIGGGGIVSAVWVITAEIVEERSRAKWSQALSVTWSCSAIAGPLLGGAFSGASGSGFLSWRWGFYINIPICAFAMAIMVLALRNVPLSQTQDASWQRLFRKFDFGGLVLFMGGSSGLIIGFSFVTEFGWVSPFTLASILVGLLLLGLAGVHEKYTTRECLFPASMVNDAAAASILVINFLHQFAFTAGTFYLALFYQAANGSTPLQAGLKLLPYSLGSSLASMPVAWFIGYWQSIKHDTRGQNLAISCGLFVSTLGFGLLILLNERAPMAWQIVFPLIAGIGLGMLFHAPYQVFTKALKPSEIATGTSAFFLVRFTGATVGLAVAGTIFFARSSKNLPDNLPLMSDSYSIDYSVLQFLEPAELREKTLQVISSSIQASALRHPTASDGPADALLHGTADDLDGLLPLLRNIVLVVFVPAYNDDRTTL